MDFVVISILRIPRRAFYEYFVQDMRLVVDAVDL